MTDFEETLLLVKSRKLAVSVSDEWASCSHVWEEADGLGMADKFCDVECRKCGCPGEYSWSWGPGEVVWPTT